MPTFTSIHAQRIVVIMPNWLGDAVMATPFLKALRTIYPAARISAVARPLAAPACESHVDEIKVFGKGAQGASARWMRGENFELGILLPNSFRSAWTLWRGGVKRRLGYARGGRSLLLTDRIKALKKHAEQWRKDEAVRLGIRLIRQEEPVADGDLVRVEVSGGFSTPHAEHKMRSTGNVVRAKVRTLSDDDLPPVLRAKFQPVPTIDYYLELAKYLGASDPLKEMTLSISPNERDEAAAAMATLRLAGEHFAVIVPGANFGSSKCWLPERFAQVAERLTDLAGPYQLRVILAGSPSEQPICESILAAMKAHAERITILSALNAGQGVSVGALKAIVAQAQLMICNDTGPRHFAAAFKIPTVTLFGPTDPIWAETYSKCETIVRIDVPCGPCQLKKCPIDHRCMKGLTVEMVMVAVAELLAKALQPAKTAAGATL